ncbi:MAG TPA: PKD domain-containing protein [Candidatus Thermoplasmatota archaeon]|nr:PKD domain-containing protein [Candidatus Thermoplasmatota archaeon]
MLQKIIVVIVGLFMSVVGALSPDLIAGKNAGPGGADFAANTGEATLATLRSTSGEAFARVSVLWVEVDGRRVTEDAWGTGEVDEIRFKVGIKGIDDVALAVGEKVVPLHPTDIITVRMFRGDFSYRGIGTPLASVQLQGTVKTTVLKEGDLTNRVMTRVNDLDLKQGNAKPGDEAKVAYVVLTTGQRIDTVAVEDGGARLFTEEVATAADAKNEPGNLLAKWVKLDGKLVREYTWGDGTLPKVEFEPAEATSRSIVLAFNGQTYEVPAGERIVIEDFVGEYLIYQVSGGMMRVRLDGYARTYLTAPAIPTPQQGGEGAPLVWFEFAPPNPKTTDTVQFRDRSTDDGIIVFRAWDFGDQSSGVLQDPTHRFARPGTYEVNLSVTDNDLKTSYAKRTIVVRNSEPVADFDFSPKIVNTDTLVAFTDQSYDADGTLVNWTWDFGDGGKSFTRHPAHRFTRAGNVTVTLTVTDELGGRSSLSKVVLVRNAPPLASFTYAPGAPMTLDPVQFFDNSTDRDGRIVSWNWSFGDGRFGSGSAPVHAYARPGLYTVSLTVRDDMGDVDSASTTIMVGNRPPFAEFTWSPEGAPANSPVTFTSQSSDPDGIILMTRWNFGDGSQDTLGPVATHTFPRAGVYNVSLTVTDNTLGVSTVTRSVSVANSAPRASMIVAPNPTYRGIPVTFSDASSDPDGDRIVNTTWDFGDGSSAFGRVAQHTYTSIGNFEVALTVVDENGQSSSVTRSIRVMNRPPTLSVEYGPKKIHAGDDVVFSALGIDPDLPGGTVEFQWRFSDGVELTGDVITRNFTRRGNYTLIARAADSEGGLSAPVVIGFLVEHAKPRVDFTWDPEVPVKHQLANFSDRSFSINGPIRDWKWTFGDSTSVVTLPNPSHAFTSNGTFTVRLQVTDVAGQTNFTEKLVYVNLRPTANFVVPTEVLQLGSPVSFVDTSADDDGVVLNWTWDFGDGRLSHDRHPTHPGYTSPGAYPVKLTVRDNYNATNSTTRFVNIANAPPVARWTHDTLGRPLLVNGTVILNGGDSFDPDGNPLTHYNWTMGDGTAPKTGVEVSHIFKRSGRWTVGLTVSDGAQSSVRTEESHKALHVMPDHDLKFVIRAYLPDGSQAPITAHPYSVTVRVAGQPIDGSAYLAVGDTYEVTAAAPLWVHGDGATVTIQAPFLGDANTFATTMRDDLHVVFVNFTLRMAVHAQVTPAPGDLPSPIALLGASDNYHGDPLYPSMFELPRGTGTMRYADNTPAGEKRVDIEARFVPLRYLSDARNGTQVQAVAALPNWCKVASSTTAANGSFNWTFDGNSPCYLNALKTYPAGRWEVRARPQVATAENKLSDIRAFYVDPTGGVLLSATMGLA